MTRVLIVDDQELLRAGLRGILHARYGFDIVAECADGAEVPAAVADTAPDVVLMDVRMPGVDGVTATARPAGRARAPHRCWSSPPSTTTRSSPPRCGPGASGFLLKGVPADDLQRAVRTVAEGGAWLDPGRHRPGAHDLPRRPGPRRRAPGWTSSPRASARCWR